jgi:hypothetical protein
MLFDEELIEANIKYFGTKQDKTCTSVILEDGRKVPGLRRCSSHGIKDSSSVLIT